MASYRDRLLEKLIEDYLADHPEWSREQATMAALRFRRELERLHKEAQRSNRRFYRVIGLLVRRRRRRFKD
ncbi:MAG: hypothetical protein HY319_17270 [Armatimonadetes bacterium]|nr:hypothetical protein [Armatimonadota bacterium]